MNETAPASFSWANLFKSVGLDPSKYPMPPSSDSGAYAFDESAGTAGIGQSSNDSSSKATVKSSTEASSNGFWENLYKMLGDSTSAAENSLGDFGLTGAGGTNTGKSQDSDFNTLSASQAFWAHNPGVNGNRDKFDKSYLQVVADNAHGRYDPKTVTAAQNLLNNRDTSEYLDNVDGHGKRDSAYSRNDLRAAAGRDPTRESVLALLKDKSVMDTYSGSLTMGDLYGITREPNASKEVKKAAQYFLDNPGEWANVETAEKNSKADRKASRDDMKEYIAQGDRGVTADQTGAARQGDPRVKANITAIDTSLRTAQTRATTADSERSKAVAAANEVGKCPQEGEEQLVAKAQAAAKNAETAASSAEAEYEKALKAFNVLPESDRTKTGRNSPASNLAAAKKSAEEARTHANTAKISADNVTSGVANKRSARDGATQTIDAQAKAASGHRTTAGTARDEAVAAGQRVANAPDTQTAINEAAIVASKAGEARTAANSARTAADAARDAVENGEKNGWTAEQVSAAKLILSQAEGNAVAADTAADEAEAADTSAKKNVAALSYQDVGRILANILPEDRSADKNWFKAVAVDANGQYSQEEQNAARALVSDSAMFDRIDVAAKRGSPNNDISGLDLREAAKPSEEGKSGKVKQNQVNDPAIPGLR